LVDRKEAEQMQETINKTAFVDLYKYDFAMFGYDSQKKYLITINCKNAFKLRLIFKNIYIALLLLLVRAECLRQRSALREGFKKKKKI
jgi:hypothetical protein